MVLIEIVYYSKVQRDRRVDSILLCLLAASAIRTRQDVIQITSTNAPMIAASAVKNQLNISLLLLTFSMQCVLYQNSDFVK